MWLLLDIGGTKTRLAVTQKGEIPDEKLVQIINTPKLLADAKVVLAEQFKSLTKGEKVRGVVVGIAGTLNRAKNALTASTHLPDWVNHNLVEFFEELNGAKKVMIENDSALVGLGEAHYGAGMGKRIIVYLTVSTGVGGVRITDGKIDENALGFEPGKQIIDMEHNLSLEDYVSGRAVAERFKKHPKEIFDPAIWHKIARFLAYGIHNIILEWSPDIVVLGGSMMKAPGIKIEDVNSHLHSISGVVFQNLPPILLAKLGDLGGIYGGVALLKQKSVF